MAGRLQNSDAATTYPVTFRRMKQILGEELVLELLSKPSHAHYIHDHDLRRVGEQVFGEWVMQAHEETLTHAGEWHESAEASRKIKDLMGAMYYGIRFAAGGHLSFEKVMEASRLYLE